MNNENDPCLIYIECGSIIRTHDSNDFLNLHKRSILDDYHTGAFFGLTKFVLGTNDNLRY